MKRSTWAAIIGSLLLSLAGAAHAADDESIRAFEAAQQASWNAHDAATYASAFAETAEVTNALGWHWTGRSETERMIGDGFRLVYARSELQAHVATAQMLSPELAFVVLDWSMGGALTADGAAKLPPQHGVETQLLRRTEGKWLILSQQDTTTAAAPTPSPAQAAPAAPMSDESFPTAPPPVRRCILAHANGNCLIYGKPRPAKH